MSSVKEEIQAAAEQPILGWHFIASDHKLKHRDDRIVIPGETLSVEGDLILCERGLHASRRALDALRYTNNNEVTVCRVECWGDVQEEDDKLVARNRRALWMYDATKVLHQFAVDIAREALDLYAPDSDNAVIQKTNLAHRHLLDLKQRWIDGETLSDAAWSAARSAAWSAARSSAARSAAWSSAAWSAVIERFNDRLESMLTAGAPVSA